MAHLLYRCAATEGSITELLLNPYADEPVINGYSAVYDQKGKAAQSLLLDIGVGDVPETSALKITLEGRWSDDEDWQETFMSLNVRDGKADPAPYSLALGTVQRKVAAVATPFPSGIFYYDLTETRARFVRVHYVWEPTAYPLLIAIRSEPLRRPVGVEWRV